MKNIFFLLLLLVTINVKGQQNITLSVYDNQTEIRANGSVTLTDGFYIPAGKTVHIFTSVSFVNSVPFAGVPSSDQNYVSTRTFKVPGVSEANINAPRSTSEENQSIEYFDGLGRPLQTVTVQGSPGFKDLVQPVAYDEFGREPVKYLPYADQGTASGGYKSAALSSGQGVAGFYNSPTAGVIQTGFPFSKTVFEPSPLNRVLEQGATGASWQPASSRGTTGRTVVTGYGTNNSLQSYTTTGFAVRLWTATAVATAGQEYKRTLSSTGYYTAGQLYLTVSKDENWTTGKAGTTEEYKDKDGRVVLKRTFNKTGTGTDATETLSTYYVYDDFGNLSFVLPPGANPDGVSISQANLDNYCYQYRYDGRHRLIEKWIPGTTAWGGMVYNTLDQVVLSQDPAQASAGKWMYTKYDAFGRVISTGIYSSTTLRPALQTTVDGQSVLWESRSGSSDYSNLAFPQSGTEVYTVNYYDNYSFPSATTYSYTGASTMTNGLLTGSKVKVLGTTVMLLGLNYYDKEGRLVKNFTQHYLSGAQSTANYDETENSYSFSDELVSSTRIHHAGTAATTIATRYEYDHMGRKLATFESINGAEETVLSKLDYNEIGQLIKKSLHSSDGGSFLQSSGYAYNERGWLKKSSSDQFSYELKYQDGTSAQYNGNISGQLWGAGTSLANNFSYSYDPLNRLVKGASTGIVMSEELSYDVMGNIKTMKRDGGGVGTYSYTGNRLNQVSGAPLATGVYGYDAGGKTITDGRTGVSLTYNMLNLPATVTRTGSPALSMSYVYDAAGNKLRKVSNGVTRNYINGIEYEGGVIDVIHTEEGLARNNGGTYSYEYNLTDHLGNVRYSFHKDPVSGALSRLAQTNYYPFGKTNVVALGDNKYLYNGKELQEELGQFDYGARFYDPVIGRFSTIDPLSEKSRRFSAYVYGNNNPIRFIDPDGMEADDWYQSKDLKNVKWVDGSSEQAGYTNIGATASIVSSGANGGAINLNADGTATNAQTGENAVASVSGKTQISGKPDNAIADVLGLGAYGLDITGAGVASLGQSQVASIVGQASGQVTGNMGAAFQAAKSTVALGEKMSAGATLISAGLLYREGFQVSRGQMDGGRFGYHVASFGTAVGAGATLGGPAGALVGLGTRIGEFAYDTSKSVLETLTGQWGTFNNSINSAIMQSR